MGLDISNIVIIEKGKPITEEQLEKILGSFTVEFCGDYKKEIDDVEVFDVLPDATDTGFDSSFEYLIAKFRGKDIEEMIDFYINADDYYIDHIVQRKNINFGNQEAIVVCAEY